MKQTPILEARDLSVSVGGLKLVDQVSFSLLPGSWLMVAGPNGAGKSTLIDALSGGTPYDGSALLDGRDVKSISRRDFARSVGVLAQQHGAGYAFTVEEVVNLGRYCHAKGLLGGRTDEDERQVEQALKLTGLSGLRGQSVLTLSGGELQRTFLAQLFAQNPRVLLLDEPTNHLDLQYQAQLFQLISDWLGQGERAVLSVVHDLSLARLYGNQALLLSRGRAVASGSKEQAFSPQTLNQVYQMDVFAWMDRLYQAWKS